jgi:hypothetical protein
MTHIISFIGDWSEKEKKEIQMLLDSCDQSTVRNQWTFSHYPGSIYFANRETWDERIRSETFEDCYLRLKEYYQ